MRELTINNRIFVQEEIGIDLGLVQWLFARLRRFLESSDDLSNRLVQQLNSTDEALDNMKWKSFHEEDSRDAETEQSSTQEKSRMGTIAVGKLLITAFPISHFWTGLSARLEPPFRIHRHFYIWMSSHYTHSLLGTRR
jgi:hypothetical protein